MCITRGGSSEMDVLLSIDTDKSACRTLSPTDEKRVYLSQH